MRRSLGLTSYSMGLLVFKILPSPTQSKVPRLSWMWVTPSLKTLSSAATTKEPQATPTLLEQAPALATGRCQLPQLKSQLSNQIHTY